MKDFVFVFCFLIILGVKTYAQEIYVPITSFHYKEGYAGFNYDSSSPFYYKVDGELKPGYVETIPYNQNNLGMIYTSSKGYMFGAYYNSYHRLAVISGKNFYIYKGYPVTLSAAGGLSLTGYQRLGLWTNPYYVLPFYTLNFTLLDRVVLSVNHYFVAIGLKFNL